MRGIPPSLRFFGAVPLATLAAAASSCSTAGAPGAAGDVHLEPTIVAPEGLIGEIALFSLDVYRTKSDGGGTVSCDPSGSGKLSSSAVFDTPIASSESAKEGAACDAGAACFQLKSVPNSAIPDVFSVVGYADAAMKKPIAYGCQQFTLAPVADGGMSTYAFTIALVPVQICGDDMIEPPETCDPSVAGGPTTEACTSCQTGPDLLSSGSGAAGSITTTGMPGDKRNPFFLWPTGGDFLAFFTDASANAAGSEQISMRIRDTMFAPTAAQSSVTQTESIYLPDKLSGTASSFPPPAEADDHKQPVAVQVGSYTDVVFADDAAGPFSIVLRVMDGSLNAQQASPCAVSDTSGGESGALTSPSVAASTIGGTEVLFIAWQDDSGRIYGRTYTPGAAGACGTLGTQAMLSSGAGNTHVAIAGTPSGWIASWQSGTTIQLRPIESNGTLKKSAVTISSSGHTGANPVIASLSTGSSAGDFAVAWTDQVGGAASSIYAQRYFANGAPLDMSPAQVSVSSNGGEVSPAIAASTAVGGSYVVTWVDTGGTQEVRARLLSGATTTSLATQTGTGAGYLHNTIDGTTGEFVVSEVYPTTSTMRTRATPTIAVGGAGFMAFGWADDSTTAPFGIIGRRFPLPTE